MEYDLISPNMTIHVYALVPYDIGFIFLESARKYDEIFFNI